MDTDNCVCKFGGSQTVWFEQKCENYQREKSKLPYDTICRKCGGRMTQNLWPYAIDKKTEHITEYICRSCNYNIVIDSYERKPSPAKKIYFMPDIHISMDKKQIDHIKEMGDWIAQLKNKIEEFSYTREASDGHRLSIVNQWTEHNKSET